MSEIQEIRDKIAIGLSGHSDEDVILATMRYALPALCEICEGFPVPWRDVLRAEARRVLSAREPANDHEEKLLRIARTVVDHLAAVPEVGPSLKRPSAAAEH